MFTWCWSVDQRENVTSTHIIFLYYYYILKLLFEPALASRAQLHCQIMYCTVLYCTVHIQYALYITTVQEVASFPFPYQVRYEVGGSSAFESI